MYDPVALPLDRVPGDRENLHPDIPLRQLLDVWVSFDGSNWVKFVAEPGQASVQFIVFGRLHHGGALRADPLLRAAEYHAGGPRCGAIQYVIDDDYGARRGLPTVPRPRVLVRRRVFRPGSVHQSIHCGNGCWCRADWESQIECRVPFFNVSNSFPDLFLKVPLYVRLNSHQTTLQNVDFYYSSAC